jgi:oligopeptidase B
LELTEHEVTRIDPYFWMRERDTPEVKAHLAAENAYVEATMAPFRALTEALYQELLGRIEEDSVSAPFRDGSYFYYSRTQAGRNYRQHCRRRDAMTSPEEVYLDENVLAEGHDYFALGLVEISPDERIAAVAEDTSGDEIYDLRFKDLVTGEWLDDEIDAISGNGGNWDASGAYFFYIREEESTQRPYRLYRHRLGTDQATDELVLEESDPLFYLSLSASQDRRYLFALSESKLTTEARWIEADAPLAAWRLLLPRTPGVRYYPDHHEGRFLLHTNREALHFQLVSVDREAPDWESAVIVEPHQDERDLVDFTALREFLVVFFRVRGQDEVHVRRWDGAAVGEELLRFDDPVYVLSEGANVEYDTGVLNLEYSSPTTPTTVFEVDLATGHRRILKESKVPSGHDHSDYLTYRLETTAADGVRVPITVVHRRDVPLDGTAPCYLYGYGAYGDFNDPSFNRPWLTYLERGFVCAIAHVRGGGLLGEPWHQAGKLEHKANTFSDFITCAEFLIDRSFTAPERLVIHGESAGGLLVGAVLNARPELFAVALADVPFVDVVTTMLDESLPLTSYEWEEWGDPHEETAFHRLLSYSPYDNVRALPYPPMLVTAGLNDPRVSYWEPAKWVARLRDHSTGPGPILLKVNTDAGHGGASARYEAFREIAFQQAFVLSQLGLPSG